MAPFCGCVGMSSASELRLACRSPVKGPGLFPSALGAACANREVEMGDSLDSTLVPSKQGRHGPESLGQSHSSDAEEAGQ